MSRPRLTFVAAVLSVLWLHCLANAQYFLKKPLVDGKKHTELFLSVGKDADFDGDHPAQKQIVGTAVEFVPVKPKAPATLKQLEGGFLLGKFATKRCGFLGTDRTAPLEPGTYNIWIMRADRVWLIAATDKKGEINAVTNEVTLHIDKDYKGALYKGVSAHMMVPPYPLRDRETGAIVADYDDPRSPPQRGWRTVTIWTEIDDPYTPGTGKVCWPYTTCYDVSS